MTIINKIKRSTITKINTLLKKLLKDINFEIAGSYRRGDAINGDIDIVMSIGKYNNGIELFSEIYKIINNSTKLKAEPPYRKGNSIISFYLIYRENKYPTDIFFTTEDEFIYALLAYTGSQKFEQHIRAVAKRNGYKLNQYGVFKQDKRVNNIHNEKDIFRTIGVTYREPNNRIK